jgi:hypothetical protein
MAKMINCPCGWTPIKKHAMIHSKDCHLGLTARRKYKGVDATYKGLASMHLFSQSLD